MGVPTGQAKAYPTDAIGLGGVRFSLPARTRGTQNSTRWDRRSLSVVCLLTCFSLSLHAAPPPATAVAFSPDGKLLAAPGSKQLLVWDPATGKLTRKLGPLPGAIRAIAFAPDGKSLALALGVPGRSGSLTLIDLATSQITALPTTPDEQLAVSFSPDGKFLAAGGTNQLVEVWRVGGHAAADLQLAATLKTHTGWITGLAFTPDSKVLASSSLDQHVKIWDTADWTEKLELPQNPNGAINGVAYSPEGDLLAFAVAGAEERALRTWFARNAFEELDPARRNVRVQTRALDTGTCLPLAVAFLATPPTGQSRLLAACSDRNVRIMARGGGLQATLAGATDWVYAVAASPDGKSIAAASADGAVRIWNPTGKLLFTLREETPEATK